MNAIHQLDLKTHANRALDTALTNAPPEAKANIERDIQLTADTIQKMASTNDDPTDAMNFMVKMSILTGRLPAALLALTVGFAYFDIDYTRVNQAVIELLSKVYKEDDT
jgi:hypothetical protein